MELTFAGAVCPELPAGVRAQGGGGWVEAVVFMLCRQLDAQASNTD